MEFARKYKDVLVDLYVYKKKSTYEIAQELGTYANKVRLALKFLGVEMRGYKDAQSAAIETGRAEHPTKGKTLTEAHKRNVGRARSKAWSELSDEDRERVSQLSRDQWQAMTPEAKDELFKLAAQAVRETSKEGSQTEKFVLDGLRKSGYFVQFHAKIVEKNKNLEVDLVIPDLKIAIEINGPAHFLPIWGEQKLLKHQEADEEKKTALLEEGYCLIRIKQLDKSMSITKMERVLDAILGIVKQVEVKFPKKNPVFEIGIENGQIKS